MNVNIFEEVKERSSILQVCELVGIKLERGNKAVCPFHKEKTASFSVSESKQIWKCFGCNEGGDSINLVSKIYNVSSLEAAKIINDRLNLGIEIGNFTIRGNFLVNKYEEKRKIREQFKIWENKSFQVLCDYLHLLWKWEKIEDFDNELFVEALQKKDYIGYLIEEVFINGTDEEKLLIWKNKRKELIEIEKRVGFYRNVD